MNHKDGEGNSCLHIAAAKGSNAILRILLNVGAKVSAKNKAGNTAVELAQNAQTIDVLKGAGATMPEFPEEKKNNLLIEYAQKGATGGALMALQAGADVNHKGGYSATALHYAAREGHEALAQGRTSTRQTSTGPRRSTRPHGGTSPRLPRCCWRTGPKSIVVAWLLPSCHVLRMCC